MLNAHDGSLDSHIAWFCEKNHIRVDGDVFGQIFSDNDYWDESEVNLKIEMAAQVYDLYIKKKVKGYFGKEISLTRRDYIKRWRNSASECANLANSAADYYKIMEFADLVAKLAGEQWDRLT